MNNVLTGENTSQTRCVQANCLLVRVPAARPTGNKSKCEKLIRIGSVKHRVLLVNISENNAMRLTEYVIRSWRTSLYASQPQSHILSVALFLPLCFYPVSTHTTLLQDFLLFQRKLPLK